MVLFGAGIELAVVIVESMGIQGMEVKGKGIEVGDIVLGYHKGYWLVLEQTKRLGGNTNLLRYQRVDRVSKTPLIKSCDQAWCTKIDPEALYHKQITEAYELMDMLMKAKSKGTN
jgi:hypothetical protein